MNVNNNELLNVFTNFINRKNSSEKKLIDEIQNFN